MSYPPSPPPPPSSSPAPYGPGPAQPVRKRGRTPLRLALIFGVVGIALIVAGTIVLAKKSFSKVDGFQRVSVAAGQGNITLDKGNHVAYYEASKIDENAVPIIPIRLTSPSGHRQILRTLYGGHKAGPGADNNIKILTYDYDGHNGIALFQFSVSESGKYLVEFGNSQLAAPDAKIAFGTSIGTATAVGAGLLVPGVLLVITAIILLIVGLVKRSRHKKELATAGSYGYPPPPGYGPPAPGYGPPAPGYGPPPGYAPPPQEQGWQQPPPPPPNG
jgi:hypothetical protein